MEIQSGWVDEKRVHSHPVVACNRPGPSCEIDRVVPVLPENVVLDDGVGWSAVSSDRDPVCTVFVTDDGVVVHLNVVHSRPIPNGDSRFGIRAGQVVVVQNIVENPVIRPTANKDPLIVIVDVRVADDNAIEKAGVAAVDLNAPT